MSLSCKDIESAGMKFGGGEKAPAVEQSSLRGRKLIEK